jgi:THO complex subunit 2
MVATIINSSSFSEDQSKNGEGVIAFIQDCVLPRCMFSAPDALYCAKFAHLLHTLQTPSFSMLQYFDKALKDLPISLLCMTEYESVRMGRFLRETLVLLEHFRSSPAVYAKECGDNTTFCTNVSNPQVRIRQMNANFTTNVQLKLQSSKATYDVFLKVHSIWHTKLLKLFLVCLDSKEYMEVRNALMVLTKIVEVFPTFKKGAYLEKKLPKFKDGPKEDLKVLASRYVFCCLFT